MSQDWHEDIKEFMDAIDQGMPDEPCIPDERIMRLRKELINEEVDELKAAMKSEDLTEIADGGADSIVVIIGTMLAYGIDMRPIWDIVHRANMAKTTGPKREDGKQLKPPGWQSPEPEIMAEIMRQMKDGDEDAG